jgi:hypothetical protein
MNYCDGEAKPRHREEKEKRNKPESLRLSAPRAAKPEQRSLLIQQAKKQRPPGFPGGRGLCHLKRSISIFRIDNQWSFKRLLFISMQQAALV